MIIIDDKFERKQDLLIVGKDHEGYIDELKKGLSDIEVVEWNRQEDFSWEEERAIRVQQPENGRAPKIIVIHNIEDLSTVKDLPMFFTEGWVWKCYCWIVTDSFSKINQELMYGIFGGKFLPLIGEVTKEDEIFAKQKGLTNKYNYEELFQLWENQEIELPDFSIIFLGSEKITQSPYPTFEYKNFRFKSGEEEQLLHWKFGGLISPQEFTIKDKKYILANYNKGYKVFPFSEENMEKILHSDFSGSN